MERWLQDARRNAGLTQVAAAARLGVSQPYLSQMEKGARPVSAEVARAAAALFALPATVLPLEPPSSVTVRGSGGDRVARRLAALGYPPFAHLRGRRANPATVLLEALSQTDLDTRVVEALPWVALTYPTLDWPWLVREAKLRDLQNRLGFVVALARSVARSSSLAPVDAALAAPEAQLERSRLVHEDTLCRESMPRAERVWLALHRSDLARHWRVLTGLTAEQLKYAH